MTKRNKTVVVSRTSDGSISCSDGTLFSIPDEIRNLSAELEKAQNDYACQKFGDKSELDHLDHITKLSEKLIRKYLAFNKRVTSQLVKKYDVIVPLK